MPTRREIKFMYVLIQNEIFFVTAQIFVKRGCLFSWKFIPRPPLSLKINFFSAGVRFFKLGTIKNINSKINEFLVKNYLEGQENFPFNV